MANLLSRLLSAVRPAPKRIEQRGADGPDLFYGLVAGGYPTPSPVDLAKAMETISRFPLVWACVGAIADDISRLPYRIERPVPGSDGQRWEAVDHPQFEALLRSPVPSGRIDGITQRRQVIADYVITRCATLYLDAPRRPTMMRRVHPEHVEPVQDTMGLPVSYKLGSAILVTAPVEQVLQARGISWSPDAWGEVYATTPIEALSRLLATEQAIMDGMRRQSRLGRPQAIVTAPDTVQWSPAQAQQMASWLREWSVSEAGALVWPFGGAKWTEIGNSPRDMEYQTAWERINRLTCSVFRVPPSRVIEGSANYATAQQEAIAHWEARMGEAAVLDSLYTEAARRFPGFEGCRYRTDFSGTPAVQAQRDAAIARATTHILNGMNPAKAYEVEGLEQAAAAMATAAPATPAPRSLNAERHLRAALERLDNPGEGLTAEQARQVASTLRAAEAARKATA